MSRAFQRAPQAPSGAVEQPILNDHRAKSPAFEHVVSLFVSITCLCVCVCQIAPAENPDVTERMVIITGTPEAQFKVKTR